MGVLLIFGARSIALGACLAIQELYKDCTVRGFLVTDTRENPETLCGLPVMEAASYGEKGLPVLLAIPQDIQAGVQGSLEGMGYQRVILLGPEQEAELMQRYYERTGQFRPLKNTLAEVYMAKSHKDQLLKEPYEKPGWVHDILAGAALFPGHADGLSDDTGDNISAKNANYCELTALYWVWKNRVCREGGAAYYGLFQYRRVLDLSEGDIAKLEREDVDVVLPYPMACEPSILEHHTRYVKDPDWEAMKRALSELQPGYAAKFPEIFDGQYMYNYNMILAKREVLKDYCEWLFPILERTESLSEPKGSKRADRYIGYLGENLLTLYFLCNREKLNIRHTGRILLV